MSKLANHRSSLWSIGVTVETAFIILTMSWHLYGQRLASPESWFASGMSVVADLAAVISFARVVGAIAKEKPPASRMRALERDEFLLYVQ